MSAAEHDLEVSLRLRGVDAAREYRFGAEAAGGPGKGLRERLKAAGLKDWRSDFVIHDQKLLIEVEGGGWTGGRHTTGAGFENDLLKYDAAMRLGWTVYRCSPAMIKSGQAIKTIMLIIELRNTAKWLNAKQQTQTSKKPSKPSQSPKPPSSSASPKGRCLPAKRSLPAKDGALSTT